MPVPAHPVFYEALDDYNLTSFSRLLKPRNFLSNGKGFISMNGIYQDPSAPVTLFIPTNEAVDNHIRPPSRICAPIYGDFCIYFISYHAAPGMWYFDEPNEKYAHTIIPTAQRPPEAKRRWWEFSPNALVAVTERDATGALKTTFRDQNVSIIASMPESPQNNIKLYLLDGVLKLPPTYKEFLKSNRDARIFQELRDAASSGGVELETSTGFTAFIPIHQPPQLLQKARKLFPTQASLSVFYSNHIIANHIIWSTGFKNGYWRSEARYPYVFDKPKDGPWSVSLNGVKATIVTADVGLANGVVHFIDTPFWNPTPDVDRIENPAGTSNVSFEQSMLGSSTGTTVVLLALLASWLIWWAFKKYCRRRSSASGIPAWQADLDGVSEVGIPASAYVIDPFNVPQEDRRRSSEGSVSSVAEDGDHEEGEMRFRVANPSPLTDDASSTSTLRATVSSPKVGRWGPSPLSQDAVGSAINQLISIEEDTARA